MSDFSNNDPTEAIDFGGNVAHDFNRTIVIGASEKADAASAAASPATLAASLSCREIEDIVGGVNISPYISSRLDLSAQLDISLDALDEKYALLEEFAHGGNATVYIARDRNLRRLVAVKSPTREGGEQKAGCRDAFVAEAKVTAQLDHPGIVPIYGLFRDEEKGIHLVMKLVNGKTLREYLQNVTMNYRIRGIENFDEDMQLRRRLEIFLRVCDTIAYAHHRDVIHQDLKPENIMIGKYMDVYVMDWGLAKSVPKDAAPQPSAQRQVAGTPRYFPPEVLRGEPQDKLSEIFTLGLILQEIVTLQYAIVGRNAREQMAKILNGELEPIVHLYHRKVPKHLQAIILKATAYHPMSRYQSAEDLAEDLRRYMADRPIAAMPDTLWDKLTRYFLARRR